MNSQKQIPQDGARQQEEPVDGCYTANAWKASILYVLFCFVLLLFLIPVLPTDGVISWSTILPNHLVLYISLMLNASPVMDSKHCLESWCMKLYYVSSCSLLLGLGFHLSPLSCIYSFLCLFSYSF